MNASPTCGLCETPLTGGYLCDDCTAKTAGRLARMPRLYEELEVFLTPGPATGERTSTRPAEAGLPVDEGALSLRGPGGIVGVLEDWRAAVCADRRVAAPPRVGPIARRVEAAARGLAADLDWVAAWWPVAAEFAAEVRALEGDVLSVVDRNRDEARRRRVGGCVAIDPSGVVCGAVVYHRPGESRVTCAWCGCVYGPSDLLALAGLLPSAA